MGIAQDLLAVADRLADPASEDPEQASLRRAVSTAYYALFHLLVQEAAQCWNGSATVRSGLERTFTHKIMKTTSLSVANNRWRGWSTASQDPPAKLQSVAKTFVQLQDDRHGADYDNSKVWTRLEAQEKIAEAKAAFLNWEIVRTDPVANEYLLSLLIGSKRE